jgi:hypothetical protein
VSKGFILSSDARAIFSYWFILSLVESEGMEQISHLTGLLFHDRLDRGPADFLSGLGPRKDVELGFLAAG